MNHLETAESFTKEHAADTVHDLRTSALARFRELGLPTTKEEGWRFTNVAPVTRVSELAEAGAAVDADVVKRLGFDGAQMVFVDGRYREELSELADLPDGVRVLSLAVALHRYERFVRRHLTRLAASDTAPFVALNTAFLKDGAFVHIERNIVVEEPIRMLHIATGKACYPRNLFVFESGAQATLLETWASAGEDTHFTDSVTETVVAAGARIDHYRLQFENENALHISAHHVNQERDSNFRSHVVTLGGALTRNDINVALDGPGSETTLNGLFMTRGREHVDNHTYLEHRHPHCDSHELYKGILDERSSGVFSGRIHVFEDAQKTDAKQSSANLLLSDKAVIDCKPQLEIYADDVKCTHGATIGQLDEDALFYLRTRGLSRDAARSILIRAFAGDITGRIRIDAARERVDALLAERLPGGSLA